MKARPGGWRTPGLVLALAAAVAAGCDGREPAASVDRESFIEAYVALRVEALRAPGQRLTPARSVEVLAERGLTEQDLLEFAEAHGRDLSYMVEVWREVSERVEGRLAETAREP